MPIPAHKNVLMFIAGKMKGKSINGKNLNRKAFVTKQLKSSQAFPKPLIIVLAKG